MLTSPPAVTFGSPSPLPPKPRGINEKKLSIASVTSRHKRKMSSVAGGGRGDSNGSKKRRSPKDAKETPTPGIAGSKGKVPLYTQILHLTLDALSELDKPDLKLALLIETGCSPDAGRFDELRSLLDAADWPKARRLARKLVPDDADRAETFVAREQFYQTLADGGKDEQAMAILRDVTQLASDLQWVREMATSLVVEPVPAAHEPRTAQDRQGVVNSIVKLYVCPDGQVTRSLSQQLGDAQRLERASQRPPYRLEHYQLVELVVQCLSTLELPDLADKAMRAFRMCAAEFMPVAESLNYHILRGNWKMAVELLEQFERMCISEEVLVDAARVLLVATVTELREDDPVAAHSYATHGLGYRSRLQLGKALCGSAQPPPGLPPEAARQAARVKCWDEFSTYLRPDLLMSPRLPSEIIALAAEYRELADSSPLDVVCKHVLPEQDEVWELAFSPRGDLLAAGTRAGELSVYEAPSFELLDRIPAHSKGIQALEFSPCGRYIASGSADSTVTVYDTVLQSRLFYVQHHDEGIGSVLWLPDGRHIVSGGLVGELAMWNLDGTCVWRFVRERILALALDCSGSLLALGVIKPEGQLLFKFDSTNWEFVDEMKIRPGAELTSLSASPHSPYVLSNDRIHGRLVLYDVRGELPTKSLVGPLQQEYKIMSSFGGHHDKYVVSGSEDRLVYVFNRVTGERVAEVAGHKALVTSVKWAPGGNLFASASDDQTVRVWQASPAGGSV